MKKGFSFLRKEELIVMPGFKVYSKRKIRKLLKKSESELTLAVVIRVSTKQKTNN